MAGERIDSLTEARRLAREHRMHDVAHVTPDIKAGGRPEYGVTGTGLDGIEVDLNELRHAESELAALHDGLLVHLRDAVELAGPLGDGSSPVTGPMRRAFKDRADLEGGVQAALLDYIGELISVRAAILETLNAYDATDDDALTLLNQQAADLEREVH
jgi:hypothetical protein